MPDINEIKRDEMTEIIDFYYFISEFGYIFYDKPYVLDEPFRKILEGINEVREIVDNNYGM